MSRPLLGPAVGALLLTGGGALWALRSTWSSATVRTAQMPKVDLAVTGADVVPGAVGIAIVVMAAALGVLAAGPRLRRVIGLMVASLAVLGVVLVVLADPQTAMDRAQSEAAVSGVAVTWTDGWARAAAAVALAAAAVVGLAVAWFGPRWATMGARYESPAAREPEQADLWKAMDDGVDPTD